MHGPGTRRGGRVAPVRLQRLPARCLAASRWRTSTASLHIGLCPPTHGSKGRVPIPPRLTLWVTGDSQSPELGARLGGGDAGFAAVNRTAARKCKLRPSSSVRGPKNSAKRPVVPTGGSPGQLTFRLVGSTPPATLSRRRHGFDPRWGCPRSEATRLLRRRGARPVGRVAIRVRESAGSRRLLVEPGDVVGRPLPFCLGTPPSTATHRVRRAGTGAVHPRRTKALRSDGATSGSYWRAVVVSAVLNRATGRSARTGAATTDLTFAVVATGTAHGPHLWVVGVVVVARPTLVASVWACRRSAYAIRVERRARPTTVVMEGDDQRRASASAFRSSYPQALSLLGRED